MDHDVHAGILGPLAVAKTLWQVLAASADGSAEDDFLRVFLALKMVKQHKKIWKTPWNFLPRSYL